jgi:hypothetical protein
VNPSRPLLALAAAAACATLGLPAQASSHREAPFITTVPKVDATDFYMFRSYEPGREGFVTLIANYMPLQDPYGGPNYFSLDPNALYEIHIDNNGDAREDLSFQFRFRNTLKDIALNIGGQQVSIPLIQAGQISGVNPATLNLRETYSIDVVRGDRRSGQRAAVTAASGGATEFDKPVDFIGTKTFGSLAAYESYAGQHMHTVNIPGCSTPARVFVGQRKDPFVVSLGRTFDLINYNPLATAGGTDDLAGKNVTTLAMEVAASCLTNGSDPVIGAWTTASLRQGRLIQATAQSGHQVGATKEGGPWAQVSRLGMPLVNEVVIGLKDKDRFNSSKPRDDGQFATYVTNPALPALIELLFSVPAPTNFPRTDLVTAFLTGIPGLNQPTNVTASEMLRLNTSIAPTPRVSQNALGVLGGDAAGFPNGRRPGDDVVDAALRVAMGVLCTLDQPSAFGCRPSDAPAGGAALTDGGTNTDPQSFPAAFPYLNTPLPGSQ